MNTNALHYCRYARTVLALLFVAAFSGCSLIGNVLNPYKSEFSCPLSDQGLCIGLPEAYDKAIDDDTMAQQSGKKKGSQPSGAPGRAGAVETVYEKATYQKLARLIKEPVTPIVAPPKVMRVLLLPYRSGENDLYMLRYAYFFVDDPKWVLGNYLSEEGGE